MSELIKSEKDISLIQKLIDQSISGDKFLEEILTIDQSTLERVGAEECVGILENPDVKSFFYGSEWEDKYNNALSFEYFHVGQNKAILEDYDGALEDFHKSLSATRKIQNITDFFWGDYVEATIAYLENDLDILEKIYSQSGKNPNKNVIKNLFFGLRNRGAINYKEDYSNK